MKVHFQFPAPITIAPKDNPRLKNLFGNLLGAMFVSEKNKASPKVPQLPLAGFSETKPIRIMAEKRTVFCLNCAGYKEIRRKVRVYSDE